MPAAVLRSLQKLRRIEALRLRVEQVEKEPESDVQQRNDEVGSDVHRISSVS